MAGAGGAGQMQGPQQAQASGSFGSLLSRAAQQQGPQQANTALGSGPAPGPQPQQAQQAQAMPNIFDASAMGLYGAGNALGNATTYTPGTAGAHGYDAATAQAALAGPAPQVNVAAQAGPAATYDAARVHNGVVPEVQANRSMAGQIAQTDLSAYMNPYTTQVIDQGLSDLNRALGMQTNDLERQIAASGAYGGSRQAVLQGELNRAALDTASRMSSDLRQDAFNTALQAAGADADARTTVGMANAANDLNAQTTNAQLQLARAQGNQDAENQAGQFNAASRNDRRQFDAGLRAQTRENNADRRFQNQQARAQRQTNVNLDNAQRRDNAANFQASAANDADRFNIQAELDALNQRIGAASQLGDLSGQAFEMGQAANRELAAQGALQQDQVQQIINGLMQQYAGYQNAPANSINLTSGALNSTQVPTSTSQTSSSDPGLFGALGGIASLLATPMTGGASLGGLLFS